MINIIMKMKDVHASFKFDGYSWREPEYQNRRKPKPVNEEKTKQRKSSSRYANIQLL